MGKFVKKPVVVDAVQLNFKNWTEVSNLGILSESNPARLTYAFTDHCNENIVDGLTKGPYIELTIPTLEGPMLCQHGDWIITGVRGERYPCKPDIFEETYEPYIAPPRPKEEPKPDWDKDLNDAEGLKYNYTSRELHDYLMTTINELEIDLTGTGVDPIIGLIEVSTAIWNIISDTMDYDELDDYTLVKVNSSLPACGWATPPQEVLRVVPI